jgi:exopolyphosphatase/guanosine-5'-triphosphate,3'-diphosphate pyrophosphatase
VLLRHIEDGPSWWAEVTEHDEEDAWSGATSGGAVPLRIATPAG